MTEPTREAQMREAFEAWARDNCPPNTSDSVLGWYFRIWQAATQEKKDG